MDYDPASEDIPVEEDVRFDTSTSCTLDGAVMRLLGWNNGYLYRPTIQMTGDGLISDDQLKSAHPSALSLGERLEGMHDNAKQALFAALERNAPHTELDLLEEKVKRARAIAIEALKLKEAIADELAKGKESKLRLDAEESELSGAQYITHASLDHWFSAHNSHGSTSQAVSKPVDSLSDQTPQSPHKAPRKRMRDQEKAILQAIEDFGFTAASLPAWSHSEAGVKAKVKQSLQNSPLFVAKTSFDKSWGRLRDQGAIAEKP